MSVGGEEYLLCMFHHSLAHRFHLLLVQVGQVSEDHPVLTLHLDGSAGHVQHVYAAEVSVDGFGEVDDDCHLSCNP